MLNNTISFSGLDGSGKTTIITALKKHLEASGYEVEILTMYDDASFYAVLRSMRDFFTDRRNIHKDIKLDEEIERKRSKSFFYSIVRSRYFKRAIFIFDLFTLLLFKKFLVDSKKILLMDRYLYDYLVDLLDHEFNIKNLKRITNILPKPMLSVFVDVSGEIAFSRKGEYDPAYLNWRRTAYREIFEVTKPVLILDNTKDLNSNIQILLKRVDKLITN